MPDLAMRRLNTLSAQSRRSPSSILISIMYSSPQKNASGPPVGSGGPEAGVRSLTLARILYGLARALRSLLFLLRKLLAGPNASSRVSAGNLHDVLRRRPFGALNDIELHTLTFS